MSSEYWDLQTYFNDTLENTPGYNPDALFPKAKACKPGTRGTIEEDSLFLRDNIIPFLDHFWTPWDPAGGDHNAIRYGRTVFDEAVQHFADGFEELAFFDFGRCVHVLEDMGSVPHLFADFHPGVLWVNASGFEKWCSGNRHLLLTSTDAEPVASLPAAMEALGRETYRAARISGTLHRDPERPFGGDLSRLFPAPTHAVYVPANPSQNIREHWWVRDAGSYFPGDDPVAHEGDAWGPVPSLPYESLERYYFQRNQEHIVPANVWDGAAWVPNAGGHSLAQLWAGVGGLRASPDQEHHLIPRAVEYVSGFLRYLWDFVNPPPHLSGVRIEQDQNGDGIINAGADEVLLERAWVTNEHSNFLLHTTRSLQRTAEAPAMRLPVRIELLFSEPVRGVTVALGAGAPTLVVGRDLASERGPPTDAHPDGAPRLLLPDIDLSGLPDGTVTLFVTAEDLSNHAEPVASGLDPDPSTRAGRLPDGSWRNIESGGEFPGTDRNHSFRLGALGVRGVPSAGYCAPGHSLRHAIQVRNLGLPAGTRASFGYVGSAPGWHATPTGIDDLLFPLPGPSPQWIDTGASLEVVCDNARAARLELTIGAVAGGASAAGAILDHTAVVPLSDHPDDTQSVTNRRYPTPWPVETSAPIGILLNGWGAGIGHLLGRYGIATAPVSPDLRVLNGGGADVGALEVLVIGSGGLAGLDRLPAFREGLERFVGAGGVLVVLTPQRGAELAALPGGAVAGYGWSEDQACFGAAVRIAGGDAALAGQTSTVLDVGADGYLTRWPDDAQVLLERSGNGQPAMIAYRHGAGLVYVATLYPDWSYGAGQSSPAERALVRDLVTAALAWPAVVPEHRPGDPVAVSVMAVNRSWSDAAAVSLEPLTPERVPLPAVPVDLPLSAGEHAAVPLALTAPADPGVYPVGYRLLDAGGAARQTTGDAAFFAVHGAPPATAPAAPDLQLWVTAPSELVPIGGTATATVHLRNGTPDEISGAIAVTWADGGALLWTPGVRVPSGGEAEFPVTYPVPLLSPFTLLYGLFEGTAPFPPNEFRSRAIAVAAKGFDPFPRRASVALSAPAELVRPGVPFPVTARIVAAAPGSFEADVALRLVSASNRELWAESRRITIPAAGAVELAASVLTADGEPGHALLVADVRADGTSVGQTTIVVEQPALSLEVLADLPQPWDPARPAALGFTVRNTGPFATPPGSLSAALADAANVTRWTGSADLPALQPGEEANLSLVAVAPDLPFGACRLRHAAEVPGGRFAGFRLLRNDVSVTLAATPADVGDGETLEVAVGVTSTGDFAVSGTLALDTDGLVPALAEQLSLPSGDSAQRTLRATVTPETPVGTHPITATFRAASTVTVTARVFVPPPRLEFVAVPGEVAAGAPLGLTALNTGRTGGDFAWSLRLLAPGDDPDDPGTVPLSRAAGTCRLGPADSAELSLPVPAALASGTYALAAEARDARSGLAFPLRRYVFVRGAAASLALATDREVYAAAEAVSATVSLVNSGADLDGAMLELWVAGAGPIEPAAFAGTVHVSPAGDDALGDGSAARPYATPQRGADAAPAGHRVLLLAGEYRSGVTLRPGTILQGEVVAGEPAAAIVDADVIGGDGTVVDHVAVRNGNVVFPGPVDNARVTDCAFDGGVRAASPLGQGIVFQQGVSRVLVGRNRLSGYAAGRAGVQFFGAAADVLIHENVFSALSGPGNNGTYFGAAASRVTVQGNTFAALAGGCNGVQVWGDSSAVRSVRVLNNRFAEMSGDCNGVHVWERAEAVEVRGNDFASLAGACGGIHLWEASVAASISDNALTGFRGDASGIQLWEAGTAHRDARIENNRISDLAPLDDRSRDNGIVLWERTERAVIARNVLERVTAGALARLSSGIVVGAGADALAVERNVVRGGSVGIALRPAEAGPSLTGVTLANNLLAGNEAGLLEENLHEGDVVELRDSIILGSTRAGVLALVGGVPGGGALISHSDFFDNARDAEGRPGPAGGHGNISADPLFADLPGGDLRLLPGSPCVDAGSRPGLDIGPLDGDLLVALGPRPVAPAGGGPTRWSTALPLTVASGEALTLEVPVEPLVAAGALLLAGRLAGAPGQTIAEAAVGFTIQSDPVRLLMRTPREFYRPGEPAPVALEVTNTGAAPVAGLVVRVTADGDTVFAQTVSLDAGQRADLAFEVRGPDDTLLHAVAGLAAADLRLRVAAPVVSLSLTAPETAGDEPFTIGAVVANDGLVPADLRLDLAGTTDAFTLQPAEKRAVAREVRIGEDAVFVAQLTGDVTDAVARAVRYGPRLALLIEANPVLVEGPATATLAVSNGGSLPAWAHVALELRSAAGGLVGSWPREIWLPPGVEVRESIALGGLAPGEYLLSARAGAASAAVPLQVLAACVPRIVAVRPGTALDGAGRLPVAVRVRNDGAAGLDAELALVTEFARERAAVSLGPGEERELSFALGLPGVRPGDYSAVATLTAEGAAPAGAAAAFRLEAALSLVSVPPDAALEPGTPGEVVVEVGNTGLLRGGARVRLVCGTFHESEVVVSVDPGGTAGAHFPLTLPADAAGGVPIPATIELVDPASGRREARDFSVWAGQPLEVSASGALDRAAYADGEEAAFRLEVSNALGGWAPLRALIGHGDRRIWSEFTLTGAPLVEGLDLWRDPECVRLEQATPDGSLTSSALDLLSTDGAIIEWDADVPAGTTLAVEVRTGPTPVPDDAWTAWEPAPAGEPLPGRRHRFLQYRASLRTTTQDSPALREVRIRPREPSRHTTHTSAGDFYATPLHFSISLPVDFSLSAEVVFGVYTESGRALLLDALPLRRAGTGLTAWTDRPRYSIGDTILVGVAADRGGPLVVSTPWETRALLLDGPGTTTIASTVPVPLGSGTYLIEIELLGDRLSLPFEVDGYLVQALEAVLEPVRVPPGQEARLSLLLRSTRDLEGMLVEGWITGGRSSRRALSLPCTLVWGLNRVDAPFGTDGLAAGGHSLAVTVAHLPGDGLLPLPLAFAEAWFEVLAPNQAPRADAGADIVVPERAWVRLDGGASTDPDGDPLTWRWLQTAGPTVTLLGTAMAQPLFVAPPVGREGGTLAFTLTVSDGSAESPSDSVEVSVVDANRDPVAVAGPDRACRVGETAEIDATGSHDPDGDPLTFSWELASRPAGSAVTLAGADQVVAALVPDVPGDYAVRLAVSDGLAAGPPDTVVVSTVNSRPRADAGEDRTIHSGERVLLDGRASDDPDGDALAFAWAVRERPQGSTAPLEDQETPQPSLLVDRCGAYLLELVVHDGALASEPDTVRLACVNSAPLADAGPDRVARLGERVLLDGCASRDGDGDALAFAWAFTARPDGSSAALDDAAAATPAFVADRTGTYALSLVVRDAAAASEPDGVAVAVGTDVAKATIGLLPAALRLARPPASIRARIELPDGFSAAEIAPAAAAITAVGKRVLARPVRRIAAKGAIITDADRDGRPEMSLHFPAAPLLPYLRPGAKAVLTLKGPLATWGRFVGSAPLKALP